MGLVDAQKKLSIPLSNKENDLLGNQLLLFDNTASLSNETFPQFKGMLSNLWSDSGIQRAFQRRNEFQLTDSVQYFLDNIDRIAALDYVPTLQDILYCRKTTKGVIETRIEIDRVPFLFVDVGGQRTQRQKWFQCFDSVTSILFMASTSEYDQVLLEDRKTNRVQESRNIFQTIVNNIIFENISVILFLNKVDLLEQKVSHSNITHYFPEFKDSTIVQEFSSGFTGNPNSVDDVKKFLLSYFLSSRRKRKSEKNNATVSSLHSSSGYQQHQNCLQRREGHHTEEKFGLLVVTVDQHISRYINIYISFIVYINQYYHLDVNQIKYNDDNFLSSLLCHSHS